jgi:hypothetical protein
MAGKCETNYFALAVASVSNHAEAMTEPDDYADNELTPPATIPTSVIVAVVIGIFVAALLTLWSYHSTPIKINV